MNNFVFPYSIQLFSQRKKTSLPKMVSLSFFKSDLEIEYSPWFLEKHS